MRMPLIADTSGIRLVSPAGILDAIDASSQPPVVIDVNAVVDDQLRVTWGASDSDLDQLKASVHYRPRPNSAWIPIAVGITDSNVAVDPAMVPGGGSAQVRVLVTDGFHTTVARSQTFTMPDHPPSPTILSPLDGTSRPQGREILFEAQVFDPEDGFLSDTVEWRSDVDGVLGTGSFLAIDVLSIGEHRVTLSVTDSARNSAEAVVHLLVLPTNLPAPEIQEVVESVFSGEIELAAATDDSVFQNRNVPRWVWLGGGGLLLLIIGLVVGLLIGRRSRAMPASEN